MRNVNFPSISGNFNLGNSHPLNCNLVYTVEINNGRERERESERVEIGKERERERVHLESM